MRSLLRLGMILPWLASMLIAFCLFACNDAGRNNPDAGDVDATDGNTGDGDAGHVDGDAGDVDAGDVDAADGDAGDGDAGDVDGADGDLDDGDAGDGDADDGDAGDGDAGDGDAGEPACIDQDDDGYGQDCVAGQDCDDANPGIHPGAAEVCGDGIDQDCDGVDPACVCPDADGDGFEAAACGGTDCNDFHPAVNPGAEEICDGLDNDCDSEIDEGFAPDCLPCQEIDHPACSPGDVRACGSDLGECVAGVEVCDPSGQWSGTCERETGPANEIQDGLDNDCDGTADEGFWAVAPVCPETGVAWRVDGTAPAGGDGLSWATAFATLEEALVGAGACDEIWVRAGTWPLTATVAIAQPIRIFGGFAGTEVQRDERDPLVNVTTFDGSGSVLCFTVNADSLLDGLTIANCHSDATLLGGAIRVSAAALHLRGAILRANRADTDDPTGKPYGGAVYAEAGAMLSIEDTLFETNLSKWYGGAVAAVDSSVLVRDSWFVDNHLRDWTGSVNVFALGGAIYTLGAATLTVIDCVFEANHSWMGGGAIHSNQAETYVLGSTFRSNVAFAGNSGVEVWDADAVIHGSLFEKNGTPADEIQRAVIEASGNTTLTVSGCDLLDNDDTALSIDGYDGVAALDITDSRIVGNLRSIESYIANLHVFRSQVEDDRSQEPTVDLDWTDAVFTDCLFRANRGRALDLYRSTARVDSSRFLSNYSRVTGGALMIGYYSAIDVSNSIFADNYCRDDGSVAYLNDHAALRMDHVSIIGNPVARENGAAVRAVSYSSATLTNGLVWGNGPRVFSCDASSGSVVPTWSLVPFWWGWDDPSLHNLIAEPSLVDPIFGDYRLAPWSPAIDAGTQDVPDPPGASATDIQGRARNLDGDGDGVSAPDPGAFEYLVSLPNLPPIAMALDGLQTSANGFPLSQTTLQAGKTCDPEDDPLTYLWYGPRGQLSGPSPTAILPIGTAILTLLTHDGSLWSGPSTIRVHTSACQMLTATPAGGGALLTWPGPGPATVYRAPATDPTRFRAIAEDAASGYQDLPPADLDVALYAVVTDDGNGRCASNVVALHVDAGQPANGAPVIFSTPSDYGPTGPQGSEPATVYQAVFGIPYGYHLRAADPDADPLSFTLTAGPAGATIDASSGLLLWTPDQSGHHAVSIEVTDGHGGTATQSFTLRVDNRPPLADAGRDVTLAEAGQSVTLDGRGSSDPDGDALAFTWLLVSAPAGSLAVLSNPADAQPSITLDQPGRYFFTLVVSDGSLDSMADPVTIATLDARPIAVTTYTGQLSFWEWTHRRGDLVQLDGWDSWDPEGRPLYYLWSFRQRPAGSAATLDDPTDPLPTFVADTFGDYELQLVVSDGIRTSFPVFSYLRARNQDPVADAGPDRVATIGETVTFDCSLSYDLDDEALTCWWYLAPPAGSAAAMSGNQVYAASFVPDLPGTYLVQHEVEDPSGRRSMDDAIVTVEANTHPPTISSSPPLLADEGVPWTYPAAADDPDAGDSATWSLDEAPPGMGVVPTSGLVSWTPSAAQIGDQVVGLRVTDGSGLADVQAFTVVVAATPRPPRIGCPAVMTVPEGGTLARRLEAFAPNGPSGGPLSFEKIGGPAALSVAADTGLVLWTPQAGDAGDHSVSARVIGADGLDAACSFTVTVNPGDEIDADFDGLSAAAGDCDDDDPAIHPGAWDLPGDGIDQDCSGGDAQRSVSVEGPSEPIELLIGETTLVPHMVYILRLDGAADDIEISQTIEPADGGLTLVSDLPENPGVVGSQTRLAGASLTAGAPGDYALVTTVTDLDTGQVAEATTPVRVLAGPTRARLLAPGMSPGAVPVGEDALVDVAVRLLYAYPRPAILRLDRTDAAGNAIETVGWLQDHGEDADLAAGDGVYSGTILLQPAAEGSLWFRAETDEPEGLAPLVSPLSELPVTRFPIGSPPADFSDLVYHPVSGAPLLADRISVLFAPGTLPDRIEEAAADLGGTVCAFLPGIGVHVMDLPSVANGDELVARLQVIRLHPDVAAAAPSGIVRAQAIGVSDPLQGELDWVDRIKVPQAWLFGFGGRQTGIAVVDTGIDVHHPDLHYNHQLGQNVFCQPGLPCSGPLDDNAHGTMVSGIIVADANEEGMAGLLPEARLLVVKGLNFEKIALSEDMAAALAYAVGRGATLINASFGEYPAELDNPLLLTLAEKRVATMGSLMIAAAGNDNTTDRMVPAALPNTMAVGGVEQVLDNRWDGSPFFPDVGSNYGDWVDLAAPADSVFSTAPTTSMTGWNADQECYDYETAGSQILPEGQRREKGCYTPSSGTSLATPMVVGAAGLLLARFDHLDAQAVRRRLEQTARPLTAPEARGLGHGLLDVFQVVFNGSFEADEVHQEALAVAVGGLCHAPCVDYVEDPTCCFDLAPLERPCYSPVKPPPDDHGWHLLRYGGVEIGYADYRRVDQVPGGVRAKLFGPIVPPNGKRMAMLSTGRGDQAEASIYHEAPEDGDYYTAHYLDVLEQRFTVAPGQAAILVSFTWDFVTEEQAWVGDRTDSPAPDYFSAVVEIGDRRELVIYRHVFGLEAEGALQSLEGASLAEGYALRHTGWQTATKTILLDPGETGPITLRFALADGWDRALDSVLLIDDVQVR